MAIHSMCSIAALFPRLEVIKQAHRFGQVCVLAVTLPLLCASFPSAARVPFPQSQPAHSAALVDDTKLVPEFWLAQLNARDQILLTPEQIAVKNAHVLKLEDELHDLFALPPVLPRAQIKKWIGAYEAGLNRPLFDELGNPVSNSQKQELKEAAAIDSVADQVAPRFGLVVQRAALRAFPSALRVFSRAGDTDIDRFQESAEFPGTPVAIVHSNHDGEWVFVVSNRYAAWMEKRFVAEGPKAEVFEYTQKTPFRIITAAKTNTVYTREEPRVSELQLDMGVRIPLVPLDNPPPANAHVNGQYPYGAWVVDLPVRNPDGKIAFSPALLPKIADSVPDYLPLTKANLLRQAFKFLGERYGWGHSYNGRDCSGFVSEVYRSMGILLPRNTSDQATSPGLLPQRFEDGATRAQRDAAIANLEVGDLIYIPGHVMMMIGRVGNEPYVIHDTSGGSVLGADGELHSLRLNGVVVTPLRPLMYNKNTSYIDRITSVVRVAVPAP